MHRRSRDGRAVGKSATLWRDPSFIHLVDGWHPAIGKAVLENWGFVEEMAQAVGEQRDHDRDGKSDADLTDVLIVGIALAGILREPGPRKISMEGMSSFRRLNLTVQECSMVLQHAEQQLGALHASLGC